MSAVYNHKTVEKKWQELQMAKGASPAEADKPADRYGSIHDVFESHDALE